MVVTEQGARVPVDAADVIVIGGGVIGLACAAELCERGREVLVLERERVGCGASEGNCGLVSPSHALPLNRPGRVQQVLRWMLRPDSPIHVRPEAALGLLDWARRFHEGCEPAAVERASRARTALLLSSRALLDEWRERDGLDAEWEARGLLLVCASEEGLAEEDALHGRLAELGVEARTIGSAELRTLEPALRDDLAGAVLFPQDAHLRPEALMRHLEARVRALGGRIEEGCEVGGLRLAAGRVEALLTSGGERRAGTYVLAAGAWSPGLARALGLRLPVAPGKGYSLTFDAPIDAPRFPLILHERSMAVTPWASGLRLGGTMEFAGFDPTPSPTRLDALRDGARRYLRTDLEGARASEWSGFRPMTPDEVPIVGRAPRHANLWLATGHGMLGVSNAPATARLVGELLAGEAPHVDPAPYGCERFA